MFVAFSELLLAVVAAQRSPSAPKRAEEFRRLLLLGPGITLPIGSTPTAIYSKALTAPTIVMLFVIASSTVVLLAFLALHCPLEVGNRSDLIAVVSLVIGIIGTAVGIISVISTT